MARPGSGRGYTLLVGPAGQDRAWAETTLARGGLAVSASSEGDVLVRRELPMPRLLVVDDVGKRPDRAATLRHLQAHPCLQGVPVVVLAYDADIDSFSDAITKGVAAYLVKPVSDKELIAVAQRLSGWASRNDRTEKRRRIRRPLLMRVDVDIRSRKLRVPGLLVDASPGGCRVELQQELQKGDLLRVILHGHEASTHVALGAEVRWHRAVPSGAHLVGLRFTGTTALLAGKLLGFVSSGTT